MSDDNETYLRWLARRWEEHKSDSFYGSTEHENQRTEEVLEVLEGIGALSKRSIGSTRPKVNRRGSSGIADNERRRIGGSEGRKDYYESTTREEARKEEVLEVFRGLSALARRRFRAY